MLSKKQRVQTVQSIQTNWTASAIKVSFKASVINQKPVITSADAYEIIKSVWSKELINLQEQLMAFYFNRANKLIGWRLISTGTMQSAVVDIKFLVCLALHSMASTVLIAHNHPSGNLQFSNADKKVTIQIQAALKLIDVSLLDHLIVTEDGYLSIMEENLI
jgi:DNA repair protein RadC